MKQRFSGWSREAVSMAYDSMGLQPPVSLCSHSKCGVVTSWALSQGVTVEEISASACWAATHTFTRFYKLDVTVSSLPHAVLNVSSVSHMPV